MKAWAVSQHTDTSKNTKAWAVSQHTDTSKNMKIPSDIPGVRNLSDDIIVFGKTQAEHDSSLQATLKRLQQRGAKMNNGKCIFSVHELFFGHVFSAQGIKADPKTIDTILGMAQYVARFIPDFASRTEPLRRLTRKDVPWKSTQQEQEAFDDIKEALTTTQVMAYFNLAKQTVLVDASPVDRSVWVRS